MSQYQALWIFSFIQFIIVVAFFSWITKDLDKRIEKLEKEKKS
jgi:hypothetical protein